MRHTNQAFVVAFVLVLVGGCELAQPFSGPGYEGGLTSEAEGPFTVSTTLLLLKEGDEAKGIFDKQMVILNEALPKADGLIGVSLSTDFGRQQRTLSVWETEEAMFGWVTSDAHGEAMAAMADHADAESGVTSWTMTRAELAEAPPSWDDAKARLDADGRQVY